MTTVLSPLLLVVLVLVPPRTEAQTDFPPCNTNTCTSPRSTCLITSTGNTCYCSENTYGDNCENSCGGNLIATTTESILTSPNFPNNYPSLLRCTWEIQGPDAIQLTFNTFNVERGTRCPFDVVRINDVSNFCGSIVPPARTAPSFTIFFRSDIGGTRIGFNATFKVVDIEDQCQSDPCLNGANCLDRDFNFTCVCAPGFEGALCEVNIDECQSSPCQNGATCVDGDNSFTCNCAGGFSGTLCDVNINECQSSPCQNGATCVDGVNSFTCDCAAGFSGTLCDVTTYALTYCIGRGWGGLVQGAPPAVNLTFRGSAGSTGTVTLTSAPAMATCSQETLTSTFIGDIQAAMVTPTACGGQLLCLQLLHFQVGVSSGAGQRCLFPSTVWYFGLQTRTLAASCEP